MLKIYQTTLESSDKELADLKELQAKQTGYIKTLEDERKEAYEKVEESPALPWYVWTLIGGAAGLFTARILR